MINRFRRRCLGLSQQRASATRRLHPDKQTKADGSQPSGHMSRCHDSQKLDAFDTFFQPVGIVIGTSVGLGIAWTDLGWR